MPPLPITAIEQVTNKWPTKEIMEEGMVHLAVKGTVWAWAREPGSKPIKICFLMFRKLDTMLMPKQTKPQMFQHPQKQSHHPLNISRVLSSQFPLATDTERMQLNQYASSSPKERQACLYFLLLRAAILVSRQQCLKIMHVVWSINIGKMNSSDP